MTYPILGQQVVGATRTFNTISNKALTTNVATLTTATVHAFAVGDVVVVYGVDSTFDGTYVVASVPTTTTFTYTRTNANVSTVAVSPVGVVIRTHNHGGVVSSSKYAVNGVCTFTASTAHGLAVGDLVRVTVGDTNMDGSVRVISVPSATAFTYLITGATIASTAVTTGAFAKLLPSAWTQLYVVPASKEIVCSSLIVSNLLFTPARYRIAFCAGSTPTAAEIDFMDCTVPANDSVILTLGNTMEATKQIRVNSDSPEVSFSLYGLLNTP